MAEIYGAQCDAVHPPSSDFAVSSVAHRPTGRAGGGWDDSFRFLAVNVGLADGERQVPRPAGRARRMNESDLSTSPAVRARRQRRLQSPRPVHPEAMVAKSRHLNRLVMSQRVVSPVQIEVLALSEPDTDNRFDGVARRGRRGRDTSHARSWRSRAEPWNFAARRSTNASCSAAVRLAHPDGGAAPPGRQPAWTTGASMGRSPMTARTTSWLTGDRPGRPMDAQQEPLADPHTTTASFRRATTRRLACLAA